MVPANNRESQLTNGNSILKIRSLDLKITIIEIKNSLDGFNSRMEMAEEAVKRINLQIQET